MFNEADPNQPATQANRPVQFWSLVRYHYGLIFFLALAGASLGYLYYLRTPPTFESKTQIFVRNDSKGDAIPFQTAEGSSTQHGGRETPHATLIGAPTIIQKALDKRVSVGDQQGDDAPRLRDIPFFAEMPSPDTFIAKRLTARPTISGMQENHEIVYLTFKCADPLTSKLVIESIIESYRDFLGESKKSGSQEVYELIDNAKTSLLNHLSMIEQEYAEFRKDMPLLHDAKGTAQLINIHKQRMNEIESERAKMLILANQRRAELEAIQMVIDKGGNRESVALMLRSIKQEHRASNSDQDTLADDIFKSMIEYELMLQELGEDHPKVRSMQKKIELMRSYNDTDESSTGGGTDRIKKQGREDFVKVCLDALKYEVRSVDAKIQQLDVMFEDEGASAKSIAAFESKNEYYIKEIARTDALYQRIVKRLDEINIVRDFGGYKINIISPAAIGSKTAPVLKLCLIIGALLGASIAFGLSYLLEANDRTFHSPEEVSTQLGLPVVGHVPVIDFKPNPVPTSSALDQMLVTVFEPRSNVAESYRGVRSSLYFSTRGEQHRIIQVTSPNPGDGKTTLCANLAVSIAQSGKRVIIIDADFRRPQIHSLFGLSKSVGMSSVIVGESELPDAIQATEVENLWALPCGPRPNNPSELLTSRRFDELIAVLREQYDFVLIDTPPLLAVTDPGAVAARVDGVILTIRLSKRTRREAVRATEILASVGANTIGVVINGSADQSGQGYGRYSGYNYGIYQYRYGYRYSYSYDEIDGDTPVAASNERTESRRRRKQRSW